MEWKSVRGLPVDAVHCVEHTRQMTAAMSSSPNANVKRTPNKTRGIPSTARLHIQSSLISADQTWP
jgi:hypothetical protein